MAPELQNYYQVLQVDPEASPEVIEAAFRRLAKIHHPDYNNSIAAMSKMQELNAVYAVLKDPVQRRIYDQKNAQSQRSQLQMSWFSMPVTPYTKTVALSATAVCFCLFAIFANPLIKTTATSDNSRLIATAEAARIEQAVIATISAMPAVEIAAHVPGISADSGPQSQYAILATTPTPLTPPTSTSVPSPTAVVIAEINEKAIDEVAPPQEGYLVSLDEAPEMQVIRQRSSQTWQKNPALQKNSSKRTVGQLLETQISADDLDPSEPQEQDAVEPVGGDIESTIVTIALLAPTDLPTVLAATSGPTPVPTEVPSATSTPLPPTQEATALPPTPSPLWEPTATVASSASIDEPVTEEEGFTNAEDNGQVDAAAIIALPERSNRQIELLVPEDFAEGGGPQMFLWEANFIPEDDYGFEVILWKAGSDPLETGFGITAPTQNNSTRINLDDLDSTLGNLFDPGNYKWSVLYVQVAPEYKRLELLADGRHFQFSNFGTTGGGGSSSQSPSSGE